MPRVRLYSREEAQEQKRHWLHMYRRSREDGQPDVSYLWAALNAHLDTLDHRLHRVRTTGRHCTDWDVTG